MQNELPKTYDPKLAEDKWYNTWLESESFKVNPNSKKQHYTILVPPPNVTGILHICLLYTSPSPRDQRGSRMPSSA